MISQAKIYLDYAATTPIDPEVVLVMQPYFSEKFGNPSSIHRFGQEALKAVDKARETIKNFLGAKEQREVLFTGSATEANNLAIKGTIFSYNHLGASGKPHIVTSLIEHESVLEAIWWLERNGYAEASYIVPTAEGLIRVEDVETALRRETILVSIHYANNEIGTIQPIREIGKAIRRFREKTHQNAAKNGHYPYFHTDAVQAVQFLDTYVDKLIVDLMTISAHKIYGPKGIGALYVRQGAILDPLFHGGGQEYGFRSGTENVPLMVGFAKAIELAEKRRETEIERVRVLRDNLFERIKTVFPKVIMNGSAEHRMPHNLNVTFPGVDGEALLIGLSEEGIGVSSSSACSSRAIEPSHVLLALGRSSKDAKSSLRITLGRATTKDEVDVFLNRLASVLKRLAMS